MSAIVTIGIPDCLHFPVRDLLETNRVGGAFYAF
jgi:hypothetical protein